MIRPLKLGFNPELDLVLERVVDIPPSAIWDAWTKPRQLVKWFTPAPWTTVKCTVDLRPGGRFFSLMRSPEGEEFPNEGTYLEVIPNQRLVWTNAIAPGFRPIPPRPMADPMEFVFTAAISLEKHGKGTKYTALARHDTSATRQKHEAIGFHAGWSAALDQLVAMVKAKRSAGHRVTRSARRRARPSK